MRARPADPVADAEVIGMVEKLAAAAEVGVPDVYISPQPSYSNAESVRPGRTDVTQPDLEAWLGEELRRTPASTARELRRALSRRPGGATLRRRDINRVLYLSPMFVADDSLRPRWSRIDDQPDAGSRPDRDVATRNERARRARVREAAHHMFGLDSRRVGRAMSIARLLEPHDWASKRLFPWQQEALRAWFASGGRGIVEAVTGTGKTHLGLEAACRMAAAGGRSVILVPSIELQRQWIERLAEHTPHLSLAAVGGESAGIAQLVDVTVALVQSACARDLVSGGGDVLLIADEAHRYGSATWSAALDPRYEFRLGLTATLERAGDDAVAEILNPYFGGTVFTYAYNRAVPEGIVALFRLAFLGVVLDPDEQQQYDILSTRIGRARAVLDTHGLLRGTPGEQAARLVAARSRGDSIGTAARDFQDRSRERRYLLARASAKVQAVARLAPLIEESHGTVVFSQSRTVAEDTAAALRGRRVRAAAAHSGMDAEERRANLDGLKDQSLTALCAPKILDEGVDVPNIDLGVIMSASSNRRQMIQRLGRVIRQKPDGRAATLVVLYAADTVEDPALGAHETFLDMVRDVAAAEVTLGTSWSVGELRALLPPLSVESAKHQRGSGSSELRQIPPPPPQSTPLPASPPQSHRLGERRSRPSMRPLARAMEDSGIIFVEGQPHWAQGWMYGLSGNAPILPPDRSEVIDWIRGVVLEAIATTLIEKGGRLPDPSAASGYMRSALLDALQDPQHLPGCRHLHVHRSVCVPVHTRSGSNYRKLSVVANRDHGPDIVVSFLGRPDHAGEKALRLAAAAGAIAVGIVRESSKCPAPVGFAVIDVAPVWTEASTV